MSELPEEFAVDFGEPNPVIVRDDRAALIEALFQGYKVLGFDTDGCDTGACMLAHSGLGGNNLDAYIAHITMAFVEARQDHDEACGI